MSNDTLIEAAKATPPMLAGGSLLSGITLPDLVMSLTLIYTVFLIVEKAPTVYATLKRGWENLKDKINGSRC